MGEFTSQHGEDRWISEHFDELGLPKDGGFFVEFGAGDGVKISNTLWLERDHGWKGLLCEPDARHQITERPNSIVERVAVGPKGFIQLGLTDDPYLSGEMRSRFHADERVQAKKFVEVASVPLSDLLRKHKIAKVDLISIDTEGTEIESWKTLDLATWKPTVAIMELRTWGLKDRSEELIKVMEAAGYRMAERTYENGIFVVA